MVLFTRKSRFAPTHVLLAGVALTTMSQSIIALATANGGAYAFLLRSLTLGSTYLISPGIALAVALCALATAAAAALGTRWLDILPLGNSVSDALGIDSRHARSEEHTSELQSLMRISYAVFCLKKKKKKNI